MVVLVVMMMVMTLMMVPSRAAQKKMGMPGHMSTLCCLPQTVYVYLYICKYIKSVGVQEIWLKDVMYVYIYVYVQLEAHDNWLKNFTSIYLFVFSRLRSQDCGLQNLHQAHRVSQTMYKFVVKK